MTDITEHPTGEGKIYCCVVIDAFSRYVVGWAVDSTQTTVLVTNALGMATRRRDPVGGLVIHTDRGVQFTSWAFSEKVRDAALAPSIGAVGCPYDNAVVEASWGRMQVELQPQVLEDPHRAGLGDPRLHRALPQRPAPALGARHADPDRVRGALLPDPQGRLTPDPRLHGSGARSRCPRNRGNSTARPAAGTPQACHDQHLEPTSALSSSGTTVGSPRQRRRGQPSKTSSAPSKS